MLPPSRDVTHLLLFAQPPPLSLSSPSSSTVRDFDHEQQSLVKPSMSWHQPPPASSASAQTLPTGYGGYPSYPANAYPSPYPASSYATHSPQSSTTSSPAMSMTGHHAHPPVYHQQPPQHRHQHHHGYEFVDPQLMAPPTPGPSYPTPGYTTPASSTGPHGSYYAQDWHHMGESSITPAHHHHHPQQQHQDPTLGLTDPLPLSIPPTGNHHYHTLPEAMDNDVFDARMLHEALTAPIQQHPVQQYPVTSQSQTQSPSQSSSWLPQFAHLDVTTSTHSSPNYVMSSSAPRTPQVVGQAAISTTASSRISPNSTIASDFTSLTPDTMVGSSRRRAITTGSSSSSSSPRKRKRLGDGSARRCRVDGCEKGIRSRGLCKAHGGGRRCLTPGCTTSDQGGGHCVLHGGGRRCTTEGCTKSAQWKGLCKMHGGARRCRFEGCTKNGQVKLGYCRSHYNLVSRVTAIERSNSV